MTTNQLDALTKSMASAESKQKEELAGTREQVKKLTAETVSLEKRVSSWASLFLLSPSLAARLSEQV